MSLILRPERAGEEDAVRAIHDLAFEGPGEGRLVDALRRGERYIPTLSVVALLGGAIVGHILVTRLHIETEGGEVPALALAPVAVHPEYHHQGIGSALIRHALEEARVLGHRIVTVLGHPPYYPRFGFRPSTPLGILPPFEVPEEVFMVLGLAPGALDGVRGTVRYGPEFDGV